METKITPEVNLELLEWFDSDCEEMGILCTASENGEFNFYVDGKKWTSKDFEEVFWN